MTTVESVPWCFDCFYRAHPERRGSDWDTRAGRNGSTGAEIARYTWESRARQGLPLFAEDPLVLPDIARILAGPGGQSRPG